jgi:hypothetical protein
MRYEGKLCSRWGCRFHWWWRWEEGLPRPRRVGTTIFGLGFSWGDR